MYSHIVVFWPRPDKSDAVEELLRGAEQHLRPIPGAILFHVGRILPEGQSTGGTGAQVGLTVVLESREARAAYRAHAGHERFKQEVCMPNVERYLVYDFE
jgi:hypothetical protein